MVDSKNHKVGVSVKEKRQKEKWSCSHHRRHYASTDQMEEVSRLFIFYGFLILMTEFYIITALLQQESQGGCWCEREEAERVVVL